MIWSPCCFKLHQRGIITRRVGDSQLHSVLMGTSHKQSTFYYFLERNEILRSLIMNITDVTDAITASEDTAIIAATKPILFSFSACTKIAKRSISSVIFSIKTSLSDKSTRIPSRNTHSSFHPSSATKDMLRSSPKGTSTRDLLLLILPFPATLSEISRLSASNSTSRVWSLCTSVKVKLETAPTETPLTRTSLTA